MNLVYLASREKKQRYSLTDNESILLTELLRKVNACDSVESIMDYLFNETKSIMPCDRLGFALLDQDELRLVSHYCVADYEPLILKKGYREEISKSSLEKVLRDGVPRIINDLEQYLEDHPDSRSTRLILKEGVRSSLTIPLSVNSKNIGLIFRSSRRKNAYTDRHAWFHRRIAEAISLAVDRTWQIQQLKHAQQSYMEILAFVSHELKTPLTSLVTNAHLLSDGYLGQLTPKQKSRVERISSKGYYLLSLIREYLDLARFESGQLLPEFRTVTDFYEEIIEPAVEMIQPQIEEKDMQLTWDIPASPITAECDPNLIRVTIVNMLSNAVNYGYEGGNIKLTVQSADQEITVRIRNQGKGFSKKDRPRLFLKFSRLDDPGKESDKHHTRRGTGLGLYTSWRIIKTHHGIIDAKSEEEKWAEFWFTLPQPLIQK